MKQQQQKAESISKQVQQLSVGIKKIRDQQIKDNKDKRFIIGVCGIPGSGKSTVSQMLAKYLQKVIVLPMDGFHILRKLLNQEGHRRRGAAFTFDLAKFQDKINDIRNSVIGHGLYYPSFSHEQKDPIEDAIFISPQTQIIIVEGLYVFDKNLKVNQKQDSIWDFKIWVNCYVETAVERVARRHLQSGIEKTYQLAYERATSNDRTNANYVKQNCFSAEKFQSLNQWKDNNYERSSVIVENGIESVKSKQ